MRTNNLYQRPQRRDGRLRASYSLVAARKAKYPQAYFQPTPGRRAGLERRQTDPEFVRIVMLKRLSSKPGVTGLF